MYKLKVAITLPLFLIAALSPSLAEDTIIREQNAVTVHTDEVVGKLYNLWDVRVINVPELWAEPGFAEMMAATSVYANNMVSVRILGGNHNNSCEWFKGVDENGKVIVDTEGFLDILRAQHRVGFNPWIILDNVPWAMSPNGERQFYGQCYPPKDMDVWFEYVRTLAQAMVDEFGMEEVKNWRFRVGTEPDSYPRHWTGTMEEYFKHYDYTVAALESVIENPRVGPGNILNPVTIQNAHKKKGRWGLKILEHCARGTNYYTGEVGTRIEFFSTSAYANTQKIFQFDEGMRLLRTEMDKYPELKDTTLEIHEFGEVRECLSKDDALSNTEFFVGLYAYSVDTAYKYNVRRIYNWDHHLGMVYTWYQTTPGLFQPWTKVMGCLEEMVDGERVKVERSSDKKVRHGAVSAWKDGKLHILAYSHHDDPNVEFENDIDLTIAGDRFNQHQNWTLEEKLLDKDNGVYIHQLYADIEAEGIMPGEISFPIQRNLERRYGKVRPMDKKAFSHGTKEGLPEGEANRKAASAVAKKNLEKYQQMGEMKVVRAGDVLALQDGKLNLNLNFKSSGIRFITLTPKGL